MQNVSLNSAKEWLSYDIVRFKIELGVEEKFMCKNVTKQVQDGDTPVQQIAIAARHFAVGQHTPAYGCIRRYAESSRMSLG